MERGRSQVLAVFVSAALGGFVFGATVPSGRDIDSSQDATGTIATWHNGGPIDRHGPFFKPLAASGRSCNSCHREAEGWTISAGGVQARFAATKGLDPIFRTNDGSVCDHNIDTSSLEGRRAAYGLLLARGLIRIALRVPVNAEFEVVSVNNPYGCDDKATLSMYRRPLPTTNLAFLTSIMWDGRMSSLADQVDDAAAAHIQVSHPIPDSVRQAIVNFESGLITAQSSDHDAGALDDGGASGGPVELATKTLPAFVPGINDPRGGDTHMIKPENAIRLFDAWENRPYGRVYQDRDPTEDGDAQGRRRAAIVRGQVLFDQMPFDIRGVAGLNDDRKLPSITGACGTCHDSPNVANHSLRDSMDTGVSEHGAGNPLDLSYLPSITLRNKTTRETKVTTDPGRALITGLWKDIGKVKTPTLRGLAARAPYFHNGSAKTLDEVIDFYDKRFHIGFSAQQKQDLVAFLSSL
jgi:cytochrome c peroxidase